jgi:hypothetical protein
METLSTLKSQLKAPERETECLQDGSYNDRLLSSMWSRRNVESTTVKFRHNPCSDLNS